MKAARKFKLNTRLLAVFFMAVFVLALAELFIFSYLLRAMEQEEKLLNTERMHNAGTMLDIAFDEISKEYSSLVSEELFSRWDSSMEDDYRLKQMMEAGNDLLRSDYIHNWSVILKDSEYVITGKGVLDRNQHNSLQYSDTYNMEYWDAVHRDHYGIRYYPLETFNTHNLSGFRVSRPLLPLTVRSYFDDRFMLVLFLDMELIMESTDIYLDDGAYLFWENSLLYTTDEMPLLSAVPEQEIFTDAQGQRYVAQTSVLDSGITLVKLRHEQEATAFLRSNFTLSVVVAVSALILSVLLVMASVRHVMDPVNRVFGMIHQHSEAKDPGFRFDACQELEVILKNREQQAAALAQRDAVLSEYFLQSKLKNVYVDMNSQEQTASGNAYILYIQVQYQPPCESIAMPRAELESCLQTMLSGTLSNLFDTTMVFQLEPGRFAARVTLPEGDDRMEERMERFMKRLEIEQEFAWFTVIQSQMLNDQDELSAVYTQVQEAARLAQVCERSQLLVLPLPEQEENGFVFTRQQEQYLMGCLTEQNVEQAVTLAEQILEENVQRGISRLQMEVLCVALVNTAAHTVTKLEESADKIAASSGVYHLITSQCNTAEEYRQAVTGFIRAMEARQTRPVEDDPLLDKINRYLAENYQRDFSSEEMAAAMHLSRSYLSTYYKSKTGINLSESIQIFRIQKAVELLQQPSVRVADVGTRVGIPNGNTFLRWFKKYTGMSPNEYRKKTLEEK